MTCKLIWLVHTSSEIDTIKLFTMIEYKWINIEVQIGYFIVRFWAYNYKLNQIYFLFTYCRREVKWLRYYVEYADQLMFCIPFSSYSETHMTFHFLKRLSDYLFILSVAKKGIAWNIAHLYRNCCAHNLQKLRL